MKYIFYLLLISAFICCSPVENGEDKIWESNYWGPADIMQLKFDGDSIKYIDINLLEHTVHKSDFSPIHFINDTLLLWDSLPFIISTTPYYSGITLPNLIQNHNKKIKGALITHISISYDSIHGYGECFFGASKGSFKDASAYVGNEYYVQLSMDEKLPIRYYDSIRFQLLPNKPKNIIIQSRTGLSSYKLSYPFIEENQNISKSIGVLPPPPPFGYLSLCELKVDTLFKFVDLSYPIDYGEIMQFVIKNPENAVILLYDETNTIEFVFQPFFKLFHEIHLIRNDYSLQEYQLEFNNLELEQRKKVRKMFPVKIRLANKHLLEKCE